MVVMTPRETWTDQRLDDLNKKVDLGFARMDIHFEHFDQRFEHLEKRFEHFETRFDGLNRTLFAGFFVLTAALIGVCGTLIGIAIF